MSKSMRRKAAIDPGGFILPNVSVSLKNRLWPVCPQNTRINLFLFSTAHLMKDIMV